MANGEPRRRKEGVELVNAINRQLRILTVTVVVLTLALGGLAVWNFNTGHTTRDALCTLRADLETRVQTSKDFLIEHPKGIPGISAKVIKDGIKNQERTIDALSDLSCDEAL